MKTIQYKEIPKHIDFLGRVYGCFTNHRNIEAMDVRDLFSVTPFEKAVRSWRNGLKNEHAIDLDDDRWREVLNIRLLFARDYFAAKFSSLEGEMAYVDFVGILWSVLTTTWRTKGIEWLLVYRGNVPITTICPDIRLWRIAQTQANLDKNLYINVGDIDDAPNHQIAELPSIIENCIGILTSPSEEDFSKTNYIHDLGNNQNDYDMITAISVLYRKRSYGSWLEYHQIIQDESFEGYLYYRLKFAKQFILWVLKRGYCDSFLSAEQLGAFLAMVATCSWHQHGRDWLSGKEPFVIEMPEDIVTSLFVAQYFDVEPNEPLPIFYPIT